MKEPWLTGGKNENRFAIFGKRYYLCIDVYAPAALSLPIMNLKNANEIAI